MNIVGAHCVMRELLQGNKLLHDNRIYYMDGPAFIVASHKDAPTISYPVTNFPINEQFTKVELYDRVLTFREIIAAYPYVQMETVHGDVFVKVGEIEVPFNLLGKGVLDSREWNNLIKVDVKSASDVVEFMKYADIFGGDR
jgi:hypothetical protein